MHRYILASFLIAVPLAVQADTLVLSDVKAQNGIQLTADELKQLMPGAKVSSRTEADASRYWTNEPGGKFIASTESMAKAGRKKKAKTGEGTWHVSDDGKYCVTLEWHGKSEKWCRYIFKVRARYYGVGSVVDDTAKAHEYEFSK